MYDQPLKYADLDNAEKLEHYSYQLNLPCKLLSYNSVK